jgi:hypothetical protein
VLLGTQALSSNLNRGTSGIAERSISDQIPQIFVIYISEVASDKNSVFQEYVCKDVCYPMTPPTNLAPTFSLPVHKLHANSDISEARELERHELHLGL